MKNILITTILMLSSGFVFANDCKPKTCDEQLADAKKEIARLRNQIKQQKEAIAKLESAPKQTIIKTEKEYVTQVIKEKSHKNIVSGYIINSEKGLNRDSFVNKTEVSTKRDTGIGLLYQRQISDKIYLGAGADTNRTYNINLGLGF